MEVCSPKKRGRASLAVTEGIGCTVILLALRTLQPASARAVRDVRGGGTRGGGARARHVIHLEYGSRSSHG